MFLVYNLTFNFSFVQIFLVSTLNVKDAAHLHQDITKRIQNKYKNKQQDFMIENKQFLSQKLKQ